MKQPVENTHLYKLKMVPSDACLFCEEDWQTTEHLLQNCKRHNQERCAAWPETSWWRTT